MKKSALIFVMVLFLAACAPPATTAPSVENSQVPPAAAPATAVNPPAPATAVNPPAPATAVQPAAAMDGAALLEARCSVCHSSDRPKQAPHRSKSDWENTVNRMIGHGAQLTDAEKQTLVDYLAQKYGN